MLHINARSMLAFCREVVPATDTLSGYVTGQIIDVNGGQYMP